MRLGGEIPPEAAAVWSRLQRGQTDHIRRQARAWSRIPLRVLFFAAGPRPRPGETGRDRAFPRDCANSHKNCLYQFGGKSPGLERHIYLCACSGWSPFQEKFSAYVLTLCQNCAMVWLMTLCQNFWEIVTQAVKGGFWE